MSSRPHGLESPYLHPMAVVCKQRGGQSVTDPSEAAMRRETFSAPEDRGDDTIYSSRLLSGLKTAILIHPLATHLVAVGIFFTRLNLNFQGPSVGHEAVLSGVGTFVWGEGGRREWG